MPITAATLRAAPVSRNQQVLRCSPRHCHQSATRGRETRPQSHAGSFLRSNITRLHYDRGTGNEANFLGHEPHWIRLNALVSCLLTLVALLGARSSIRRHHLRFLSTRQSIPDSANGSAAAGSVRPQLASSFSVELEQTFQSPEVIQAGLLQLSLATQFDFDTS
jgi:hypothetical protein